MKKRIVVALCAAAMVFLGSWGFLVHRTVNQLAIYQLPNEMNRFFYEHQPYLVKNAVRPDERRNTDSSEASKHFMDFEYYGDSAVWKMPTTWSAALKKYPKDTLIQYGNLPYVILETQQRLTKAFRQKNTDSILFYAADLGHYIADAHVPLHTSLYYDGLPGQKGLHSLWESTVPEIELNSYNLTGKTKARYIRSPEQKVWQVLRHSFSLTGDVFAMEKEVSKNFTDDTKYRTQMRRGKEVKSFSTDFAKAYAKRLGFTINQQLLYSANTIADFWYTAWIDGGKPNLNKLIQKNPKALRKTWKDEVKAYKRNKLLEQGKLIARKPQTESGE